MLVQKVEELQTAAHISVKPREDVKKFVSVTQCEERQFPESRQDSALIGLLLQIRHNSMVAEERRQLVTTGSRYGTGANVAQRQRLGGGNRNYDRLALFADTREPGRCFAIIFKNPGTSQNFFNRCIRTHEGVGNVFFLDEPTPVTSTLGSTSSVPIIEQVWDCVPVNNTIQSLVPTVLLKPPEMGFTRYFASHHVKDIKFFNACFVESICSGIFCDRQFSSDNMTNPHSARCGCFHYDRSSAPLTIQFDIALTCPFEFDQQGVTYVNSFRSYKTTLLFIRKENLKYIKKNSSEHLALLRNTVQAIATHVNNNGGWSYVGWLRTGTVHDISETQTNVAENLASTSQTPHLSYLYPTNELLVRDDNQDFRNLQLSIGSESNTNNNLDADQVADNTPIEINDM